MNVSYFFLLMQIFVQLASLLYTYKVFTSALIQFIIPDYLTIKCLNKHSILWISAFLSYYNISIILLHFHILLCFNFFYTNFYAWLKILKNQSRYNLWFILILLWLLFSFCIKNSTYFCFLVCLNCTKFINLYWVFFILLFTNYLYWYFFACVFISSSSIFKTCVIFSSIFYFKFVIIYFLCVCVYFLYYFLYFVFVCLFIC